MASINLFRHYPVFACEFSFYDDLLTCVCVCVLVHVCMLFERVDTNIHTEKDNYMMLDKNKF